MSVKTQATRAPRPNDSAQDLGFTRYGYNESGSLCVLDITFSSGDKKTLEKPGNSRGKAKETPNLDLDTAAFPITHSPNRQHPTAFARLGYDRSGNLVVLESGPYRRKDD